MQSCLIPTGEPQAPGGPSIENLDQDFDFQIVVFEVENTFFRVLRNGFNVPGTPFEAMFAPQTTDNTGNIDSEGSSLENPIRLPGVKMDHFRSFLRILYPFIDQTPVEEFDEWIGVLNLATMWHFKAIREKAISQVTDLIKDSGETVMERIALAREYRVGDWLLDAYLELAQNPPLNFDEIRPAEPSYSESNTLDLDTRDWEAEAKNWKAISKDWETLARISQLQTKVANSISSVINGSYNYCQKCVMYFGPSYKCLCKCRLLALANEAFREELESLKENPEHIKNPQAPRRKGTKSAALPKKRKKRKRS